jgi:hypothetical protein
VNRLLAVSLVGLLLFTACGKKAVVEGSSPGPKGECGPAATALAAPTLPPGFPTPSELTYTVSTKEGPSSILDGYWKGSVEEAFAGYREAFGSAGYTVTHEQQDASDAEVNFSGGNSTGQVKLVQVCIERTSVKITIRRS